MVWVIRPLLVGFVLLALAAWPAGARAETAAELNHKAASTLNTLYTQNVTAKVLSNRAKGILVFPEITKAGIGIGGSYGEGVLMIGGRPTEYYSIGSGSLGLTLGAQSYSEVVMFMTDEALAKFRASKGWEAGVDGSVVAIKQGQGGSYDTTNASDPVVGFIFGQTGLMLDASFEGSKYTRIEPPR